MSSLYPYFSRSGVEWSGVRRHRIDNGNFCRCYTVQYIEHHGLARDRPKILSIYDGHRLAASFTDFFTRTIRWMDGLAQVHLDTPPVLQQ